MIRHPRNYLRAAMTFAALAMCTGPATAQTTGPCCLPDGTWDFVSPRDCHAAGGVFKVAGETLTTPCSPLEPGISMSQTAVRRLVREGVIHTLWSDASPIDLYTSTDPDITGMWALLAGGAVIAPQFHVDLRDYSTSSIIANAEAAAADVISRVEAAQTAWDTAHPTLPFYWALRLQNLGQSHRHEKGAASMLATFSNHREDLPDTTNEPRVAQQDFIEQAGSVGSVSGSTFQVHANHQSFFGQFDDDYYTETPSTVTIDGTFSAEITAFDPFTWTFTLDAAVPLSAVAFTISRGDPEHPTRKLLPCYFFYHGAIEVETWVNAFCEYITMNASLPDPVAVVLGVEDIGEISIDWANYVEYLADPKASNANFKIDANHTLAQWDAAFAGTRDFEPLPTGGYSPLNSAYHSYLGSTFITAYNYHREQSTWVPFRAKWPRASLTQYILGKGYGVTHDSVQYPVPTGPETSSYDGTRDWKGSIAWDAYYCVTNPYHGWATGPDGGVNPLAYEAAQFRRGYASPSMGDLLVVDGFVGSFDPSFYLIELGERVFVQFTTGENGMERKIIEVFAWDAGTSTFTLADDFEAPIAQGDEFVVYVASNEYRESEANTAIWPTMETFCSRYGHSVDQWGFESTMKKWAAEQAWAQSRALPENPYVVYYSPGTLIGYGNPNGQKVSFQTTYPHASFTAQDGWLSGQDWAEIGVQAMNYGVNHFVWFRPLIMQSGSAHQNFEHIIDAITAIDAAYWDYLPVYEEMRCIADWDNNGILNHDDVKGFYTAYSNADPIADLNKDGEFTSADVTLFDQADGCGLELDCDGNMLADSEEIDQDPDLDLNNNGRLDICENCVADWCGDGEVGVPDIFCFLNAWFANDTNARCLGGTCGVSAIFHFLSLWFGHGNGPCVT